MGAPGSGKGTISKRMVAKFGMEVRHPPYLFSPVNLFFPYPLVNCINVWVCDGLLCRSFPLAI